MESQVEFGLKQLGIGVKPFRLLTDAQRRRAVEEYVGERMEDHEWVWNRLCEGVERGWVRDDEDYYQFFEDRE